MLVVFRVFLDTSYFLIITQAFYYKGFFIEYSLGHYLLSWLIYILSFGIAKDSLEKGSEFFFLIALLFVIAPLTTMYGFDFNRPLWPVFITILSINIVLFIARIKITRFKSLPVFSNGKNIAVGISLIFVFFLLGWYYISGVYFNLDISQVYKFRQMNSELANIGILKYTNIWTYKVFIVFLMSFSLLRRKFFLFGCLCLVQVYFFAASSHKVILFLPMLLFIIWFYFKRTKKLIVIPTLCCAAILVSMGSFYLIDDVWLSSLFVRRLFFVPADLTFAYMDVFSNSPKIFWSNSILSNIFDYPYNLPLARVVGNYLGSEGMWANNGFISTGYAHAGSLGVLIYSIILGLILNLINRITYGYFPVWLTISLSIVPLMSLLISADLLTTILTHGLFVMIILILLARPRRVYE